MADPTTASPNLYQDRWEQAIKKGNLFELMEELNTNRYAELTIEGSILEFCAVIDELAKKNVEALVDQTFRLSIAASAALILRSQRNMENAMTKMSAKDQRSDHELKRSIDAHLDRWEGNLEHFMRIAAKYASIRHTLALGAASAKQSQVQAQADPKTVSQSNPGPAVKTTVQTPHSGTGNPAAAECNPSRPKASSGVAL